jgi:hypothetical protein
MRNYDSGQSGADMHQKERKHDPQPLFNLDVWYKLQCNMTQGDEELAHLLLNNTKDPAVLFLSNDVVDKAIPYERNYYTRLLNDLQNELPTFNGSLGKFLIA